METTLGQHAMQRFTYEWSTGPRIKENLCRWTKNNHYTCHSVLVSLTIIGSHSKDTSLGPLLWSLSFLSSRTTPCLRFGSYRGSHNRSFKSLNKCPRLIGRLSHWSKTTQQMTEPLNMTDLSTMKTHIWYTTCTRVKLSTIWALLWQCSTSKNRTWWWCTKLWGLKGSKRLRRTDRSNLEPEEFLEELELLLFLDDWPSIKPNHFLFWKLLWDIPSLVSFSALKAS